MKVDLTAIDTESFNVIKEQHFGEELTLVFPYISAKWTKENLIFRSSLWNQDGELISAGFPKFFNWEEKPNIAEPPTDLRKCKILEKLDGSLLIVSKYKGNFIFRTRGTIDAFKHDNAKEIYKLFEKYPSIRSLCDEVETWSFSLLFEWVSSNNTIIIKYEETPDFILVGRIEHSVFSLFTQDELDDLAKFLKVRRPKVFAFSTIDEMKELIGSLKEAEGVVVYSNGGQCLHKLKSAWYLSLHHMKSELSSLTRTLDVWLKFDKPNYNEFYSRILKQFDFELAEYSKGNLSKICDAYKEAKRIFNHMKKFVEPLKDVLRKDAAIKIMSAYGKTSRSGMCFRFLDGKEFEDEDYKKVMLQLFKGQE